MIADAIHDSSDDPSQREGQGVGSSRFATRHSRFAPPPDDSALLEDFLEASHSPLALCRIHRLSLAQLEAWSRQPHIREKLDAYARISADRAAVLTTHARVRAVASLDFLTCSRAEETARRAATTLLR